MEEIKLEEITESIQNIGVDDLNIDLFESQYKVPNGMRYNSYIIKDEKVAILDTVDKRASSKWQENIEASLNQKAPDYLVILHLEPDHSSNIKWLCEKYPKMKLVGNSKTFLLLPQFFEISNLEERKIEVKEAEKLNLGKHTLNFYMAPMVHWPEVMVAYEEQEKILFSADAFGKFGTSNAEEPWVDEARRFYINIVGKYGMQVQALLKKLGTTQVNKICSLHGPVLKENISSYIEKYNIWSKYEVEEKGTLIAYASIHGNTREAMLKLEEILKQKGEKVEIYDLSRSEMSEVIAKAYKYGNLVLASSSYNFGIFPPMEQFLRLLKDKNYQNRNIAIIENGTWAPSSAKAMKQITDEMKNIKYIEPQITIKTTINKETLNQLEILANNILNIK